ncbi:hypothetical protein DFQ28_005441 [Apophysomyces sp. BC1034]|nr:hypothetical protein DFQ30_010791 [Apophysomyces sp. BC1015]KAG0181090.1 hypothetical protein DFQ29_009405 [Apophysomyces sp. BC1021]KAG0188077.1 hypothetical protein DFQ28_005441 [Apophysomyces sp. BC1034]
MSTFKPSPQHKSYVRALYKRILSEASAFFDDRARTFIIHRTKNHFKEYKTCTDEKRVKSKLMEARKRLHRIERANRGNQASALKVLEAAYGRTGKARHRLLYPYIHSNYPADMKFPEPFVTHVPHTAPPPPLCPPLRILVTQGLGKKLEPVLPTPQYKPLHRGRMANLLWRWRSQLLQKIEPPLPFEIVCELERKAGMPPSHSDGSAVRIAGGPRWDEMYTDHEADPDLMHLCPTAKLAPYSELIRTESLPPSPFTAPPSPFATLSMIQLVDPSFEHEEHKAPPEKTPRKIRRVYRRLLFQVPFLTPLPTAASLWDESINYLLSKSRWIPQNATQILNDDQVPSEEIISGMLTKDRKKRK